MMISKLPVSHAVLSAKPFALWPYAPVLSTALLLAGLLFIPSWLPAS